MKQKPETKQAVADSAPLIEMQKNNAQLTATILAGIIARGGWDLDMFNVRNVLEKKVQPIVKEILCKTM